MTAAAIKQRAGSLAQIERCFADFLGQYSRHDLGSACDSFERALAVHPGIAFRYFLCRASGPIARCVEDTQRSREICKSLDGWIHEYPNLHLLVDWDPDLINRIVDLRAANIDKGLPSIVHVTLGKAASVPVANIFNSGFNLPSFAYSLSMIEVVESWARDFARGGACYSTHLKPKPENIQRFKRAGASKVIVHIRDPRQSILSLIHHVGRYSDQLASLARSGFESHSLANQLTEMLSYYVDRIAWIQGWMNAESELDILFSTFEDFVQDRPAFTRRYIEFYGGHEEHFSWENATRAHHGVDQHFRAGRVDEWREVFAPREKELLTSLIPTAMRERFGWAD